MQYVSRYSRSEFLVDIEVIGRRCKRSMIPL
jgi:hypothetical protein